MYFQGRVTYPLLQIAIFSCEKQGWVRHPPLKMQFYPPLQIVYVLVPLSVRGYTWQRKPTYHRWFDYYYIFLLEKSPFYHLNLSPNLKKKNLNSKTRNLAQLNYQNQTNYLPPDYFKAVFYGGFAYVVAMRYQGQLGGGGR